MAFLDFNAIVSVDVLWLETADSLGATVPALNVVDLATTFQQVIPLQSTKSEEAAKAFAGGWLAWAGTPKCVLADLDSAFKDKFLEMADRKSIAVRCAAGQGHWQNGVCERHGQTWKAIWDQVVKQEGTVLEEVPEVVAAVSEAKNTLRNQSGFSPRQWLLGSNGRLDLDDGANDMYHLASPETKFGRLLAIRLAAKTAFFETQAKEAVARATNHKPRVSETPLAPSDLVFYHRLRRPGKGKKPKPLWLGPATVIGRESSNYWVARGGKCLLVTPEHIREAHYEEVNELLRVKMALHEIKRFVQNEDEPAAEATEGEQRPLTQEDGNDEKQLEKDPVVCHTGA